MKDNTLFFRQVHPSFIQGDTISSQVFTSQVFKPTPKDKGFLSVYNSELFSAEESFYHYTEDGNKKSVGTLAVSKLECDQNNLPIQNDNIPFKGHCSLDYRGLSNNEIGKKAKKLKSLAQKRDWQFRP